MFNWLKNKQQPEHTEIRDVLFGDLPLSQWPSDSSSQPQEEPWLSLVTVRNSLADGNKEEAIRVLQGILVMPGLESRHYLQAWHFLRELGIQPSDNEAKQVYGVVVEVAMPQGLDILAAYSDRTARYFNYSGAAVIWERPDDSLDHTLDALLEAGQMVAAQIGPWEGARPLAPQGDEARISMLTPSGLHFGQGSMDVLSRDSLGGPLIAAATKLMQELIAKTNSSQR
jgi:hypothetical protein